MRPYGFGRPWYRGGLGKLTTASIGIGVVTFEVYRIRPAKFAVQLNPSGSAIHLDFTSDGLHSAKFVDESGAVAEMPMAPKPR